MRWCKYAVNGSCVKGNQCDFPHLDVAKLNRLYREELAAWVRDCGECRARCLRPECHRPSRLCKHHFVRGNCDLARCQGAHDVPAGFGAQFCRKAVMNRCSAPKSCGQKHLSFSKLSDEYAKALEATRASCEACGRSETAAVANDAACEHVGAPRYLCEWNVRGKQCRFGDACRNAHVLPPFVRLHFCRMALIDGCHLTAQHCPHPHVSLAGVKGMYADQVEAAVKKCLVCAARQEDRDSAFVPTAYANFLKQQQKKKEEEQKQEKKKEPECPKHSKTPDEMCIEFYFGLCTSSEKCKRTHEVPSWIRFWYSDDRVYPSLIFTEHCHFTV